MRVTDIRAAESPADATNVRVSATVRYDDPAHSSEVLWFEVPAEIAADLVILADPWLAALLPLACKLGEELWIEAPMDPVLQDGAREVMEWWRYWFPSMSVVAIHTDGSQARQPGAMLRSAQFFSGGVDSFFTLLRHSGQPGTGVDDLLVGWGFDIPLTDEAAFNNVRRSLGAVAKALDKRLVPFSTNLRQTRFGREIPWGTIGHGNAMAAIALLTAGTYGRVLIPSTDGYRELGPWGSHVATDHHYSCSSMRLVHDGAAYSRLDKVRLISRSPVALAALRVCWRAQSDGNCGRCEKCLRTMIALELCDSLELATTFPETKLDLAKVSRIYCPWAPEGSLQLYYQEMRAAAEAKGRTDLARAIGSAMSKSSRYKWLIYCADRLKFVPVFGALARPVGQRLRASVIF